jgi:anti-sigma B factor antagonist
LPEPLNRYRSAEPRQAKAPGPARVRSNTASLRRGGSRGQGKAAGIIIGRRASATSLRGAALRPGGSSVADSGPGDSGWHQAYVRAETSDASCDGPGPCLCCSGRKAPRLAIVEFSTRYCNGQLVVCMRGELDVADAARVAAALVQVAVLARQVIVDLEGLEFIDSSGLAALVRARKHAKQAGGDLLLAAPQEQVLRVLAITRLTEVLPVHACVEDAAGLRGRSPTRSAPVPMSPVIIAVT